MATHRADVSVVFGAPIVPVATDCGSAADDIAIGPALGVLIRVPDVVMWTEQQACAAIATAGLRPGQRDPAPRPASGRGEVVIRTRPAVGSMVPEGSRIDYDLVPGSPCDHTRHGRPSVETRG